MGEGVRGGLRTASTTDTYQAFQRTASCYPSEASIYREPDASFTFNIHLCCTAVLVLGFLWLTIEEKRAKYFVLLSILVNLAYPAYRLRKLPRLTVSQILIEGTFLSSLLYDVWTLVFPHRVFIYYLPQVIGAVGKVYHMLSWEEEESQEVVEELVKYQGKTEVFVIIYSVVGFVLRLKYSWWKFAKLVLLLTILRFKYFMHFGTQISYHEMHMTCDRLSKTANARAFYHELSSRLTFLAVVDHPTPSDH